MLAFGADLKSAFCFLQDGRIRLSRPFGDLADARSHADYRLALERLAEQSDERPAILAADLHPEYHSRKLAEARARRDRLPLAEVQHHHAHIAACLAENAVQRGTASVLGVALDGLGFGQDGSIWGGEFLLADYAGFRRAASLKPVAMLGGDLASREPWRNTYAHLVAAMSWPELERRFGELELVRYLAAKPRQVLDRMLDRGINCPLASSCGRLFDAVAGAVGICREKTAFEAEAAIGLQRATDESALDATDESSAYAFEIAQPHGSALLEINPRPMWESLLHDLTANAPRGVISARFHVGLAIAIVRVAETLSQREALRTVALSGGVFQNAVLKEQVEARLVRSGFTVLTHRRVPTHDAGIALGQAAIAAARRMAGK